MGYFFYINLEKIYNCIMEISEGQLENIYYKYLNNGKKHTLIFLHGFTGNSTIWDEHIEVFKDTYDLVLIDLLGHGKSESPKLIEGYSFEHQAKTIEKIINKINSDSISLITYSYSCYIGLSIYNKLNLQIKSMTFISPYFRDNFNFIESLVFEFIGFVWKHLVLNKKHDLDYSRLKNYENPTLGDTRYTLRSINTKDLLGSIYALKNSREDLSLENIKIPLLVIYGENDKMLSPKIRKCFQNLEAVKMKKIEKKKHLFLKTHSLEIAKAIKVFLKQHTLQ
jgi:pimeloyl-ACP methyl ester carboxylesterase